MVSVVGMSFDSMVDLSKEMAIFTSIVGVRGGAREGTPEPDGVAMSTRRVLHLRMTLRTRWASDPHLVEKQTHNKKGKFWGKTR